MIVPSGMPPEDSARYVFPVVRAKPDAPLRVVLTCQKWCSVNVHWTGKRNALCPGSLFCDICRESLPVWQGWILCESLASGNSGLVQFTPNCIEEFLRITKQDPDLCGRLATFGRVGKRVNSPLKVSFHGKRKPNRPQSFETLQRAVERVFHVRIRPPGEPEIA